MVQNQARIMQLAPATNEKSLCLQQLHHQNVVSYCTVAAGWKITTTNKPLGGKTVSGQKLCLGQNTEKDLQGSLRGLSIFFSLPWRMGKSLPRHCPRLSSLSIVTQRLCFNRELQEPAPLLPAAGGWHTEQVQLTQVSLFSFQLLPDLCYFIPRLKQLFPQYSYPAFDSLLHLLLSYMLTGEDFRSDLRVWFKTR